MSEGLAKGKGATPWVQPLLVLKTGTHEETVRLGASASAAVYHQAPLETETAEAFAEWLSGPFTKSVRRAALKDLEKVRAWAAEAGHPTSWPSHADSSALALPPMKYEDLPKAIARLQVAGTDLPWDSASAEAGDELARSCSTAVSVAVLASLTTGKATAQAAHGLWKWMLAADEASVAAWKSECFPTRVRFVAEDELSALAAATPELAVYDNGLTEVAPQTLTAVAVK